VSPTLRLARDHERDGLIPAIQAGYVDDMVAHGGFGAEEARRKAEADVPEALAAPEQAIFVVEDDDGEAVGHLWVAERDFHGGRALFVYDVFVAAGQRGRGFGREAMLLAEEEARRRGLPRVLLNVFGGNDVARKLYRSLGYEETAVLMRKEVA
jgi:ribosomal protein S18 acetylase RimI-like enzyme